MKLTMLDKIVLDFISLIDCKYVIISGYVAILFGRSRNTEDVDIFIENKGIKGFLKFYQKVTSTSKYYPLNAENANDAYDLMISTGSLRFAERGTFVPNFEIKFPKDQADFYSLNNALIVDLGEGRRLRFSPLELEIAYKLFLGSDKDFADASHLYITFKESLDMQKLKEFLSELPIKKSTIKNILGTI
ncbi:hypothetical protein M1141_00105 [Candidatus Marsarchaeota archaeon]|nr:hypothetical protein [Candidatus Marsarchaeota archaeon]